jgi:tRNA(Ile)-lysidine synthase
MTKELLQAILTFWQQQLPEAAVTPPLTPADRLLVAVSGGADSLALLHILLSQQLHPPRQIVVAHLDHGWRPTAAAEAEFVSEIAQSWALTCVTGAVDAPAFAQAQALSLEAASRQLRYQFLQTTARQQQARFILTGHQADDQVETVLHHLLRGTGLTGLRGMLPVNQMAEAPDLWLLRPLLTVSRQAIEAYCREAGLQPRVDPSNQDRRFLRNRLRAELLPLLRQYNEHIDRHLYDLAKVAAAEVAFLEDAAESAWPVILAAEGQGWLELHRVAWQALPLALRRRSLREAVRRLAPVDTEIGLATIEQARRLAEAGEVGAQSLLPGSILLTVAHETLAFTAPETAVPHRAPQLSGAEPMPLPIPGQILLENGWRLTAELDLPADLEAIGQNPDPWQAHLDADRVDALLLRSRQAGERFAPLGLDGRQTSLKEFMNQRKIPAAQRAAWPLVADHEGLVWVVGHRLADRVKVTPATRRLIHLVCRRA